MNSRENEARLNRIRWAAAARRASAGFLALTLMGVSGVTESRGQDVAGAARQEQARKEAKGKRAKRVYTEEDLARKRILTPEDRAELEARERQAAENGATTDAKAVPDVESDGTGASASLGEIARAYRAQKALAELAHSGDFHLMLENPILASPLVPVRPRVEPKAPKMVPPRFSPPSVGFEIIVRPAEVVRAPKIASPQFPAPRVDFVAVSRPVEADVAPTNAKSRFESPKANLKAIARSSGPVVAPRLTSPKFLAPMLESKTMVPPSQPATEAMEPATEQSSITVQRGDSLWKLAQKNLGSASRWRDLLAVNPSIVDPSYIQSGAQIRLPIASLQQRTSKVKVEKGDTLWGIARRMLARATFWSCIARSNPQITDANRIYAGQILNVPSDCGDTLR
jgi:nucleoid-associated protein YgaU